MRAAAGAGIPVILLDRPNPLGGAVQGNVLDTVARSFVGSLSVPMRHGLTIGELALLARRDLGLSTDLHIVPVSGWHRSEYFDATGLPFVPPSPNLRNLESVIHYPGTCLFEGTNLSSGRGSDAAFSQVGAPWLDAAAVLTRLGPQPGVELTRTTFTPRQPGDGKYADTLVQGIKLRVTDRASYDPPATALQLIEAIRAVHPVQFAWIAAHFDRLAGQPGLREALDRGAAIDSILGVWRDQRAAFQPRAVGVRLYPE
jgi:beta-N-acetylhexosaminidase